MTEQRSNSGCKRPFGRSIKAVTKPCRHRIPSRSNRPSPRGRRSARHSAGSGAPEPRSATRTARTNSSGTHLRRPW